MVKSLLLLWALLGAVTEAGAESFAKVSYLSQEAVYVDAGSEAGIAVGDTLELLRGGALVVEYVAGHSAACRLLDGAVAVKPGDRLRFTPAPPAEDVAEPVTEAPAEALPASLGTAAAPESGPRSETRGKVDLYWLSLSATDADVTSYQQPSASIRLESSGLFGREIDLLVRMCSKYSRRERDLGLGGYSTDWRQRVCEAALTYAPGDGSTTFRLGRLFSPRLRGFGNWDGLYLDHRFGERWRVGILGGGAPDLTDGSVRFDQQKGAAFVACDAGVMGRTRYRGTLAVTGNYEDGTVERLGVDGIISREYLYLQNDIWFGRRLDLHQDMMVDLLRDWRHEEGGDRLKLTSFYFHARYLVNDWLWLSGCYDRHEHVRLIDTRELPDSLFFDEGQGGGRLEAGVRLPLSLRLTTAYGVRKLDESGSESYFLHTTLGSQFRIWRPLDWRADYAWSDGVDSDASAGMLDLWLRLTPTFTLGAAGGMERNTSLLGTDLDRDWERLHTTWVVARHVDLYASFTHASGDIGAGDEVLARLGYRW